MGAHSPAFSPNSNCLSAVSPVKVCGNGPFSWFPLRSRSSRLVRLPSWAGISPPLTDQGTELRTSAIAPVGGPQNYYQLPNRVNSLPFRTDQAGAYYVSIASPKGGHAPDRVYTLSARSDDHPADTSTTAVAELEEPTRVYLMRTSSDPDDTATGQKGPVCQPLTTEGNNVTFEGQLRSVRWTMAWALSPTAPSICPIQRLQATSARSAKTSSPACKRPVVGHWPSGTGRESTPAGASSNRPLRTAQTTSSCFEWTPTLS